MNRTHALFLAATVCALLAACAAPSTPERASAAPDGGETVGSLRNARVAVPIGTRRTPLLYLAGELSPEQAADLASLAPDVRVLAGLTREQALEHAHEADGTDARFATPAFLERATQLAWMQAMSAGVDRYVGLEALTRNDRIVLTNLRGVHGPAIADHVFGLLLTLTRDLGFHRANQREGRWDRSGSDLRPLALQGRTLLVVGLGGIGDEIARRGHGFGMRVLATRRSAAAAPPYVERVGRPEDLLSMLPEADVVAIAVPLTAETEGLFDAHAFAALKPGAFLVNIARGRVVDTAALIDALDSGRLAGAGLDVTDPEPLPPDHPLWRRPNVVITPHVASDAELTDARAWALLRENVRRFGAGEPLLNVVDVRAGY